MAEINEQEREKIRKQAKQILDNFATALDKVKIKDKKDKKELGGFREEGEGNKGSEDFRKRMFENAPRKSDNALLAEKKSW